MFVFIVVSFFISLISSVNAASSSLEALAPNFFSALSFDNKVQKLSTVFYDHVDKIVVLNTGKRLFKKIEALFTQYCKMYQTPAPRINISLGDRTEFKPSDATGSPPRAHTACSRALELEKEQSLMDEQVTLQNQLQSFLEKGAKQGDQINSEYEKLQSSLKDENFWPPKLKVRRYKYMVKHIDQIDDDSLKKNVLEFKDIADRLNAIDEALQPSLNQSSSESIPLQKNKDLNICIAKEDFVQKQFSPCAVAIEEDDKVFIALCETPFYIILAHELIHVKHYLEEQIFKDDSLKATSKIVETHINNPNIASLFPDKSSEGIFKGLSESSEFRRTIFHKNTFSYFPLGTNQLLWSLDSEAPLSLAIIAYSIAGVGYIPTVINENIFPEGKGREKFFGELVKDLEERRTVVGPDRDGITEDAIRMEAGLPVRYIYQDDPMYESLETLKKVFAPSIANIAEYITQAKYRELEIFDSDSDKEEARKCDLSYKEK